jgi:uncharacterized protein (TIGR03032 family)
MTENAPTQLTVDVTNTYAFNDWLSEQGISLALTTYQTGTLFFIGLNRDRSLAVNEINLKRCMGLWSDSSQRLYVSSLYQLWRLENILQPGQVYQNNDRLYVPQVGWTTGDLDTHDIAVEANGRIVFVNTRFSCLATVSASHNFVPLWQPSFISDLAAEDRCHLNGLALRDGRAAFVTALCQGDTPHAWREHKRDGGVVIDVQSGETVLTGLSMPHSPRWYRDTLWLLESGTGHFGRVDSANGRFEPLVFCPGYLRGLTFYGDYALIGSSLPREQSGFFGLPLDDELKKRGMQPRCGLFVVDLRSGRIEHEVEISGAVQELYDVAVLPGVRRPRALGFLGDDIHYLLHIAQPEPL